MDRPKEYEFILPDGSTRYEIVYEPREVFTFMKMHNATIAVPLKEEEDRPRWYSKHYTCDCGAQWEDDWNCLCNDKCPECNAEIEPDSWEEIDLDPEEIRRLVS